MNLGIALSFSIALLVASAAVGAQIATGIIQGRVLNAVTGEYLGNARLTLDGTNLQVSSHGLGEYRIRITGVPVGDVTLRVSYTGLASQSETLQVGAGQTVAQNISLTNPGVASTKAGEPLQLDAFRGAASKETEASALALNEQRSEALLRPTSLAPSRRESSANFSNFCPASPSTTPAPTPAPLGYVACRTPR